MLQSSTFAALLVLEYVEAAKHKQHSARFVVARLLLLEGLLVPDIAACCPILWRRWRVVAGAWALPLGVLPRLRASFELLVSCAFVAAYAFRIRPRVLLTLLSLFVG